MSSLTTTALGIAKGKEGVKLNKKKRKKFHIWDVFFKEQLNNVSCIFHANRKRYFNLD